VERFCSFFLGMVVLSVDGLSQWVSGFFLYGEGLGTVLVRGLAG